jgi:hypothetical protein
MSSDLAAFFPTVLRNDIFHRDGLLFGVEPHDGLPVHWAVVDPGRHEMYVWQKQMESFPLSGRHLDASLFTNGPFTNYGNGSLLRSTGYFAVDAMSQTCRALTRRDRDRFQEGLGEISSRHFSARTPLGFVIGTREGIVETQVSRPNVFYFGRRGPDFQDYSIAPGDPVDELEAIGGLFGGVRNYEPHGIDRRQRVGYWCLAPLDDDLALQRHGVENARDAYQSRTDRSCDGLLIFVAGLVNVRQLCQLLSAIRVKHAAQIDGGDSLLMGSHSTLRQGTFMPGWKRRLQRWGIQFQPVPPTI